MKTKKLAVFTALSLFVFNDAFACPGDPRCDCDGSEDHRSTLPSPGSSPDMPGAFIFPIGSGSGGLPTRGSSVSPSGSLRVPFTFFGGETDSLSRGNGTRALSTQEEIIVRMQRTFLGDSSEGSTQPSQSSSSQTFRTVRLPMPGLTDFSSETRASSSHGEGLTPSDEDGWTSSDPEERTSSSDSESLAFSTGPTTPEKKGKGKRKREDRRESHRNVRPRITDEDFIRSLREEGDGAPVIRTPRPIPTIGHRVRSAVQNLSTQLAAISSAENLRRSRD